MAIPQLPPSRVVEIVVGRTMVAEPAIRRSTSPSLTSVLYVGSIATVVIPVRI
jgi:hypothetical protein